MDIEQSGSGSDVWEGAFPRWWQRFRRRRRWLRDHEGPPPSGGREGWALTVRCGVTRGDEPHEHGMQNLRPQHREAAEHDREYKKRLPRPEVRYLGHPRRRPVVRRKKKVRASRKIFDKTAERMRLHRARVQTPRGGGTATRPPHCRLLFSSAGPRRGARDPVRSRSPGLKSGAKIIDERNRLRTTNLEFCIPKQDILMVNEFSCSLLKHLNVPREKRNLEKFYPRFAGILPVICLPLFGIYLTNSSI